MESQNEKIKQLFKGFSRLSTAKRFARLVEMGALTPADVKYLKSGGLKNADLAEKFIENVIGYFQLPLGVAGNFCIDGKRKAIPMAVEETSIIASASKTARWISEQGSLTTSIKGEGVIGQIQISEVKNFEQLEQTLKEKETEWIQKIHKEAIPAMYQRGGGVIGFKLRRVPFRPMDIENDFSSVNSPSVSSASVSSSSVSSSSVSSSSVSSASVSSASVNSPSVSSPTKEMAVIHVVVNTCSAMGANIVNQICEYLKTLIESETKEKVSVCIVSNLSDTKLVQAKAVLSGVDSHLMQKIEQASLFAESDPYRATTNNKGVMNGIDAVLIAVGNDWRAVSAGVHAYATRFGQYQSITQWRVKDGKLHGFFEAPLMVGTVGGMTRLHPTAKIGLKMLGVKSADELARVCAAVGLTQNLGALRALTTVGIIEGHMKLHIQNLTLGAGAKDWEIPLIQKHLEAVFDFKNRISLSQAVEALKVLRDKTAHHAETLTKIKNEHQKKILDLLQEFKVHHIDALKKIKDKHQKKAFTLLQELKGNHAKKLKKIKDEQIKQAVSALKELLQMKHKN